MSKLFIKDKAFYKSVATIAIPIALQGLITSGVNAMDTVMVGKVSETALSGVSLATQFITIFQIFCMGIAKLKFSINLTFFILRFLSDLI